MHPARREERDRDAGALLVAAQADGGETAQRRADQLQALVPAPHPHLHDLGAHPGFGGADAQAQDLVAPDGLHRLARADTGENSGVSLRLAEQVPDRLAGDREFRGHIDDIGNHWLAILVGRFEQLGSAENSFVAPDSRMVKSR